MLCLINEAVYLQRNQSNASTYGYANAPCFCETGSLG